MRKFYFKVNDLTSVIHYSPAQELTPETGAFAGVHYFDGTLKWDSDDDYYLKNLGFGPEQLYLYWLHHYGERRIGFPSSNSSEDKITMGNKILALISEYAAINKEKYMGMVRALTLKYDPLASYDMTEISGSAQKVSKSKTKSNIDQRDTKAYTTTNDNSATGRLSGYSEEITKAGGETTAPETTQEYTENNISLTITDDLGNIITPNANVAAVGKSHKYGTTDRPSQEFIEKEFEVRRQNIIKEFFEDLNKEILLSTWN